MRQCHASPNFLFSYCYLAYLFWCSPVFIPQKMHFVICAKWITQKITDALLRNSTNHHNFHETVQQRLVFYLGKGSIYLLNVVIVSRSCNRIFTINNYNNDCCVLFWIDTMSLWRLRTTPEWRMSCYKLWSYSLSVMQ